MKILHMIETSGPGGAENMLINNVLALKRRGIDGGVLLIKDGWLRQRLVSLGITCHVIPLHRFFSVKWLSAVRAIIKNEQYDTLHSHEFAMNCHAAILSVLCRTPAVATVHGKNYYSQRFVRRVLYRSLSKISKFVAVSDDIKNFLVERIGLSTRSIAVIANGIDIEKHKTRNEVRATTRAGLGVGEDDILVGAVGNLYPVKGHIYLVAAAAKILTTQKNVYFVIAGRGAEQTRLQAEIDRLGIADHFHLLGFREDIDRLLQSFDIFVMPSLSEGMPLSILEAMAAKRVVVASAVGGIPEFIADGRNGVLVPAMDSEKLASQLEVLINNPGKRAQIADTAFAEVCASYSQETCTSAYLQLYQ